MIPTNILLVLAVIAVITSFVQYPTVILIIAGVYFALQTLKLLSHSSCMTCWKKTAFSGIIFLALAVTLPIQAIVGVLLLVVVGVLSLFAKPSAH